MLTSAASNRELAQRLRLHWLASLESNAQFALLSDWSDADQAAMPDDEILLNDAMALMARLNQQYPASAGNSANGTPRFLLIHRARSWCSTEKRWMGWERKRGKLEALVRLLAGGKADRSNPAGDITFHEDMKLTVTSSRWTATMAATSGCATWCPLLRTR
jgi:cyclic beta-1,2-glucan synthetase